MQVDEWMGKEGSEGFTDGKDWWLQARIWRSANGVTMLSLEQTIRREE